MTLFQALFLGLTQGLTEFLPVSSSGHLALSQYFFGITDSSLSFDVFLHFSTLLAVILFFWKRIVRLKVRDLWFIAVSGIPAAGIGLLAKDSIESLFSSLPLVLGTLFITGILNLSVATVLKKRDKATFVEEPVTTKKSFFVGLFQAIALLPGISRSGATVFGGLLNKLSRCEAFEFSFLMSVPVILGGSLLQLFDIYTTGELAHIDIGIFLAGGVAAFIAGVISLQVFRYVIEKAKLEWFGWYCISLVVFVALFEMVPRI